MGIPSDVTAKHNIYFFFFYQTQNYEENTALKRNRSREDFTASDHSVRGFRQKMKLFFAIFVVATSICAGDPDGDQEGAKSIAAMSKKLDELTKQLSQQKVVLDRQKAENEEQKTDRQQLHKEIADLKDENVNVRKTQALLRNAEVKLREVDSDLLIADTRIFEDKEKEAEKNRQAAPPRQKDDIVVAAKELILAEIKRYHATHNDTTALKKLIDAEIKRLMTTSGMVETVFVGGTPGASSEWSGCDGCYPVADAFTQNPGKYGGWTSDYVTKASGAPPQYIWYDFKRQLRPAKISYLARGKSASYSIVRVKRFQFVGTDDPVCSKNSNWKVLCGGESAPYKSGDLERGCTIPVNQNTQRFHCLGLRSLIKSDSSNGEVGLTGIRIWIYQ